MQFEKTTLNQQQLIGTGETFELDADVIYKAIGQQLDAQPYTDTLANELRMEHGKVWVDAQFQTSLSRVFAGGDCIAKDQDLTVYAVQHGKLAARAMHETMKREPKQERHHG